MNVQKGYQEYITEQGQKIKTYRVMSKMTQRKWYWHFSE